MTNEQIIESAISLLAVDGDLSQQEMGFFDDLCKRLDISKDVKKRVLAKARAGKGSIHLPEEDTDKKRLLYILVQALVADGKVAPEERKIIDAVVKRLGVSTDYVENFIQSRLEEIQAQPLADGIPASWKKEITCPKCGHKQPEAKQCVRCGIIFEKFKKTQEPTDADKLMDILASSNVIKGKLS